MLIINADDWGRSPSETDNALECYQRGRVTSVSAMVFMPDSERAAEIAKQYRVNTGLHLNFTEAFTETSTAALRADQKRVSQFLKSSRFAPVLYHPFLRREFRRLCEAQVTEFIRLYGAEPAHVDGHQHMHLCANLVFDDVIPSSPRIRRNFSFRRGEKSFINIGYRGLIDFILRRRHSTTNYFFDLSYLIRTNKVSAVVD